MRKHPTRPRAYPSASGAAVSSMVQRAGMRLRQPFNSTAATPPRNPPYHTKPPRLSRASHVPVSSTYQIFAPTMPPMTAANTMSAA